MDKNKTSWGKVANWYDEHLKNDDTFHARVILPNLIRLINLKENESMLEMGCGQGYFLEKFAQITKKLVGLDVGAELIKIAQKNNPQIKFLCASADDPTILAGQKFDVITLILALQNMKNLNGAMENVSRLLKDDGRVYVVLNHPAFRIPQKSDWGFDEARKIQYRRLDSYMSESEIEIDMTPGEKNEKLKQKTFSYHRPLQVYAKNFSKNNLSIAKIEEWISHKESEAGPRAKAENLARKEFPMFMCLVGVRHQSARG